MSQAMQALREGVERKSHNVAKDSWLDSLIAVVDGNYHLIADNLSMSVKSESGGHIDVTFSALVKPSNLPEGMVQGVPMLINYQIGKLLSGSATVVHALEGENTRTGEVFMTMKAVNDLPVIHTMEAVT